MGVDGINRVYNFLFGPTTAVACGFIANEMRGELQDAGTDEDAMDADADVGDGDINDADVGDGDTPDGEVPSVCNNSPSAFGLESPTNYATGVSIQPLINWQDSTDVDAGDSVTYQLRVCADEPCSSVVISRTGLTESQYQVLAGDALAFDTDYYWRVVATDTCPTSINSTPAVFHFRTAPPVVCDNDPGVFDLSSPTNGATGQPILPTFTWSLSDPIDAGDSITYTLIISTNPDCSSPVRSIAGIGSTTRALLPGEELLDGQTYYWKVVATDSCVRTRESSIRSFTTILCTPQTYFDTDFTGGAPDTNAVVNAGTVSLAQDQSAWVCYDGSAFPETVGWTEVAPVGWVTRSISSGILELSTEDINNTGYYERDPSISSSTGWMLESRMRLVNSQGSGACSIKIQDDNYQVDFRIRNDRIVENNTGSFYLMDPRTDFFTYRITERDGSYEVRVNDVVRISGVAAANTAAGYIRFNDQIGLEDSHAYWDYICYYNGGDNLPYVANGTYTSEIIDTGTTLNNIGTGAQIRWSQVEPFGTSIEMEVCASNDSGLAGATCASGLTNDLGTTIPGTVIGRYMRYIAHLATTLNQSTPQLQDVTIEYETCE